MRWSSSLLSGPKNNALGVKIFISMSSTCVVQILGLVTISKFLIFRRDQTNLNPKKIFDVT